ncbi:MAG: hypothetical protein M3P06_20140 [Acidobacteriota bacterium]|nr:hypothetical protein [Acidobacteriota bacterium]
MTVVAVAGRRIDADPDGERFPLRNADLVRGRLFAAFERFNAQTLVTSAACGTDLLAIEAALARGMRIRIVLPFGAARFRETSVVDRPGEWGVAYDRAIAEARARGDLIEIPNDDLPEHDSFLAANERLIAEATAFAAHDGQRALALIVTEGAFRDSEDFTEDFARHARAAGLEVVNVSTLA